ncbi:SRPBCC family protein [Nocardioides sp. J2M5]|uniref:SRPBCC family protein n=1 Tax=Nocardioides palaemonis TaxID=2829810 RepID=UPI001BA92CB2|nr:SRPBCC family protein [Nocardioides palaemonis]MBS2939975.1 SRPBCC family protein [Nocardioides palaemonis]
MPSIARTFTTSATPTAAFAYLADFRNAEEWDPGTRSCERVDGDGGEGTIYRNVSTFLGREVELTYTAVALEPGRLVHLRGGRDGFEGHDRFELEPSGAGTQVRYSADFSFSGLAALGSPVVGLWLPVLAAKTLPQLRRSLDRLS